MTLDDLAHELLEVRAHIDGGRVLRAAFTLGQIASRLQRDHVESVLRLLERGELKPAEQSARLIWLEVRAERLAQKVEGRGRPGLTLIRGGCTMTHPIVATLETLEQWARRHGHDAAARDLHAVLGELEALATRAVNVVEGAHIGDEPAGQVVPVLLAELRGVEVGARRARHDIADAQKRGGGAS